MYASLNLLSLSSIFPQSSDELPRRGRGRGNPRKLSVHISYKCAHFPKLKLRR